MGCKDAKGVEMPMLICFFELNNEAQKNYCIKLKDNFQHDLSVRYEIKSMVDKTFCIQLKIKNNTYDIQKDFNDSEEAMKNTLNKIYEKLDELPKPK